MLFLLLMLDLNVVYVTLDIKLPVFKMPKINEKLKFRDHWYKIDSIQTDSANASIKIFIIAQSKGIGA